MPTLRSRKIEGRSTEKIQVSQPQAVARSGPANPGLLPRIGLSSQEEACQSKHLKATRASARESPIPKINLDGCLTDPEPGMDSRRATVRNMRSKCRCSCVLQFTFRRAVSCVLHRPPSQVIHCTVLYFFSDSEPESS